MVDYPKLYFVLNWKEVWYYTKMIKVSCTNIYLLNFDLPWKTYGTCTMEKNFGTIEKNYI